MSLYNQLENCLVQSPLEDQTQASTFLPLSDLNETITQDSIWAQLPHLTRLFYRNLPKTALDQAKKVFAILVLIEEPWAIRDLIYQDNLRDEDLPLSRKGDRGHDDYNVLVSTGSGKTFASFTSWAKESRVRDFLHKQWVVQAPVLGLIGKHMVIDPRCPLPLTESVPRASGGSGVVHQSKLHPAHQQDFKVGVTLAADTTHRRIVAKVFKAGAEHYIAIKEINKLESFLKEKEILEKIQHLQHRHLIKLIAMREKGSCNYFIFPWADGGNLKEFWKHENLRSRTPELILWSLQQMLGLVSALKALHGEIIRHGDIKPQNILHFTEYNDTNQSEESILVIADVGVSKFHKQVTSMRRVATSSKDSSPDYEAPEAESDQYEGKPRSRRYDMWSMGCVFLEFTVWLVYEYKAIRSFRRCRKSADDPTTIPGKFFTRNYKGPAEIHLAVFEAIGYLREDPRCKGGTALEDLIQLIEERLLRIEETERAEAPELYERLEKIVRTAEEKPSYLCNQVYPPPPTPDFFSRVKSRQSSSSESTSSPLNPVII